MMATILRSSGVHLPVLCSSSPFPWFHSLRSPSRSVQTLAYEEIRTSEKPYDSTALVIHGVLGSSEYLKPFSVELLSELQKSSRSNVWRMVLVDLRNHGRSADLKGFDPPHDMFNAANDLSNLVKCHGWAWPDVVIGHSMGGKVGLEFISSCARGLYGESALLPKQLWVLDTFLGEINSTDGITEAEKILHAMQSLPSSLPSQKWVVDQMLERGFSKLVSEWIGSNLKKSGEYLTWAFNLQAVIDMFNSYRENSYWSLLEHPPKGLKIDVVRAENSERWNERALQKLANLASEEERSDGGKVSVHVLRNSGHWVQADNPKGLLEIMSSNFISKD